MENGKIYTAINANDACVYAAHAVSLKTAVRGYCDGRDPMKMNSGMRWYGMPASAKTEILLGSGAAPGNANWKKIDAQHVDPSHVLGVVVDLCNETDVYAVIRHLA